MIVGAMIVWQGWGVASVWELLLAFPICIGCAYVVYGFHIFYAELGKSIWRSLRRGTPTADRE